VGLIQLKGASNVNVRRMAQNFDSVPAAVMEEQQKDMT
jgi:hypothetical protein